MHIVETPSSRLVDVLDLEGIGRASKQPRCMVKRLNVLRRRHGTRCVLDDRGRFVKLGIVDVGAVDGVRARLDNKDAVSRKRDGSNIDRVGVGREGSRVELHVSVWITVFVIVPRELDVASRDAVGFEDLQCVSFHWRQQDLVCISS